MKTKRTSKASVYSKKKNKPLSGKKLTKALDDAIRDLYHKKYPNPYCFVCKQYLGWWNPKTNPKGCQIGHYVSRQYFSLRWDIKNIWCQCSACNWEHSNKYMGPNPTSFSIAIIQGVGIERLKYLEEKKKNKSPTTIEKRELLQSLQEQIDSL